MIASLAMYDQPPIQAANDRLWALMQRALEARGIPAPESLTRGEGAYWQAWEAPDLVLSQTCGLPFAARLHKRVTLVGTPDFGVEGAPPGHYRSRFMVRADDPRERIEAFDGAVLAFNESLSQSGWGAPMNFARARGMAFTTGPQTGAHVLSAQAVLAGEAEIAAIDAVTWSILSEHEAWTTGLKCVAVTDPTPSHPYIAGPDIEAEPAFEAAGEAIAALSEEDRRLLHLRGIVRVPLAAYLAVRFPPPPMQNARQP